MGITKIDGKDIYGKYYARGVFGPTSISRECFFIHKDILEEFEYTQDWLERKYSVPFPSISFTPKVFWTLDFKTVIDIARLVGIDYVSRGNKEYSDIERRALRRSILLKLEGAK